KRAMDWPQEPFHVPAELPAAMQARVRPLQVLREDWERRFAAYEAEHPELAGQLRAAWSDELPEAAVEAVRALEFAAGSSIATRKVGAKIVATLAQHLPSLVGGSADLAESNGVSGEGLGTQSRQQPDGRFIHFGVREHGMADRKSTRLNSSHVKISYAVFCLK